MHDILKKIGLAGIVPVIAIEDANDAVPLAEALIKGGLPCAEVTFRTKAAKEAISNISKSFPDMLLGAGTVLTIDQVKLAVDSGAKYIVSPGLNKKVVEYCVNNDIPITPGVATPSDVESALEFNLEVVKFFPAEANGGLVYLKALSGPYGMLKYIPTGGIDESNLLSYLKFNKVLACGGSWMVKSEMISNKQFSEIEKLTSKAIITMLGFDLKHVGINSSSAEESSALSSKISSLFNLPIRDGNSSIFIGTQFEVRKTNLMGKHGHIAIGTNFIERAIAYFERSGIKIIIDSKVEKNGKLHAVYLDLDLGGFAVHLIQS